MAQVEANHERHRQRSGASGVAGCSRRRQRDRPASRNRFCAASGQAHFALVKQRMIGEETVCELL
jgi:hypothetical protein